MISDNHSTNVSAYSSLLKTYRLDNDTNKSYVMYFEGRKIYLMYDSVHIIKNVRNNLLNDKRFIFPPFEFFGFRNEIKITGEISWSLLHKVHSEDEKLQSNLKATPKLDNKTLYPGNNKQDVNRALIIFHSTTSAGIKRYFPANQAAAEFLKFVY